MSEQVQTEKIEDEKEKKKEKVKKEYDLAEEIDEQQIIDEMKGKVIDQYVYDFTMHGRRVIGLSYAGIVAAARKQGNLKITDLQIEEDKEKIIAKAKGKDVQRNFEIFGVATQPKKMVTQYGDYPDNFAFVKAVAKAQRNVLRRLIPETIITEMVKAYKEEREKKV